MKRAFLPSRSLQPFPTTRTRSKIIESIAN
jgi:hypothetical protein